MKKIIILGVVCLIILQCGYRIRGTGIFLPSHIKRISIPTFKNKTTRFQIDVELTQSVIEEIVARGKVEVKSDEDADAILAGEILSFQASPIAFTEEAAADRYAITITAKIILMDLVKNRIIFKNPYFIYSEEYEVPEGTDFESIETEALEKISEKFARSLVTTILEGF